MTKERGTDRSLSIPIDPEQFQVSPFLENYWNNQTVLGIYAGRTFPLNWGDKPKVGYRELRCNSVLFDVPERPVEIAGPNATDLLEKVLARSIGTLKIGKARYAIACNGDGGILMDGIVMRLAEDRYWYVKADGEFDTWLKAHAIEMDVKITDPQSWVLQVQGPSSLEVMNAATDGALTKSLGYFNLGWFEFGGQELLVSRTGWTGELGYEIYTQGKETDAYQLWEFLLDAGKPHGLVCSSLDAMNIRRIEAGIRNNRTDMDETMTPFQAGLDMFIDLEKPEFIGREALKAADRNCLLFGFRSFGDEEFDKTEDMQFNNMEIYLEDECVGRVTASAHSPYLQCSIGYVRMTRADDWPGKKVMIRSKKGPGFEVEICELPFYDAEKTIPRTFGRTIHEF